MTEIQIPELLIRQAKAGNLVLFVGAGVSVNSTCRDKRPLAWKELLNQIASRYKMSTDKDYLRLIEYDYPRAAEFLYNRIGQAQTSTINSIVRQSLESPYENELFQPNDWHDAILNIGNSGPRIVVTTNFDTILERALGDGYKPRLYTETNLLDALQLPQFPIFKLHGCISNPATMVITESQYLSLQHKGREMLDILRSLLMTRTALFIGYSFSDPDIRSCLNSIFGRYDSSEASHFILQPRIEDTVRNVCAPTMDTLRRYFGISVLEYDSTDGSHNEGLDFLVRLGEQSKS